MLRFGNLAKISSILVALVLPTISSAQATGAVSGTIGQVQVTDGNNFGLRVYLSGAAVAHCPGGPAWAYINESDSNYKVFAAILVTAFATGNPVVLNTVAIGGYCKLSFVTVGK